MLGGDPWEILEQARVEETEGEAASSGSQHLDLHSSAPLSS